MRLQSVTLGMAVPAEGVQDAQPLRCLHEKDASTGQREGDHLPDHPLQHDAPPPVLL